MDPGPFLLFALSRALAAGRRIEPVVADAMLRSPAVDQLARAHRPAFRLWALEMTGDDADLETGWAHLTCEVEPPAELPALVCSIAAEMGVSLASPAPEWAWSSVARWSLEAALRALDLRLLLLPEGAAMSDAARALLGAVAWRARAGSADLEALLDEPARYSPELDVVVDAELAAVASAVARPPDDVADPATLDAALAELPPIERAEMLLARAGVRGSRVCLPWAVALRLARAAHGKMGLVAAPMYVESEADPTLGGFSNKFAGVRGIRRGPGPGAELLLYGARTTELASRVYNDDRLDGAGVHFDIPDCCRTAFHRDWPAADREHGGDLGLLRIVEYLRGESGPRSLPWQSNAFAMYFGAGLTWHFPCALDCQATASAIDRRLRDLRALDSELADELYVAQQRGVLWSSHRGFGRPAADGQVAWLRGGRRAWRPDTDEQWAVLTWS